MPSPSLRSPHPPAIQANSVERAHGDPALVKLLRNKDISGLRKASCLALCREWGLKSCVWVRSAELKSRPWSTTSGPTEALDFGASLLGDHSFFAQLSSNPPLADDDAAAAPLALPEL